MSVRAATAWIAIFVLLAVAGLRLMDEPAGDKPGEQPRERLSEQPNERLSARVERVVDGDTIRVLADGKRETVRYIGVDTPESVKPNTPVQCYAKPASHFNAELVEGRNVRLTLDREPRDRYGRLLAYVSVGETSVNAALLRGGFARTIEIPPNTARAAAYRRLEERAQDAGRGLWGACRLGDDS